MGHYERFAPSHLTAPRLIAHRHAHVDFDGDGIDELIVSTSSASHLFHHDVAAVKEKIEATASMIEELAALRALVAQEADGEGTGGGGGEARRFR